MMMPTTMDVACADVRTRGSSWSLLGMVDGA
jgi:hypothetical protein